jgi:hypothetical protein
MIWNSMIVHMETQISIYKDMRTKCYDVDVAYHCIIQVLATPYIY